MVLNPGIIPSFVRIYSLTQSSTIQIVCQIIVCLKIVSNT